MQTLCVFIKGVTKRTKGTLQHANRHPHKNKCYSKRRKAACILNVHRSKCLARAFILQAFSLRRDEDFIISRSAISMIVCQRRASPDLFGILISYVVLCIQLRIWYTADRCIPMRNPCRVLLIIQEEYKMKRSEILERMGMCLPLRKQLRGIVI